ncbi:AEC family transporter [Herbaspirillum sp. RTI4]|uniref:AEC family transporter n=1 Tax=Herbaspirillum sp. RTI4 TaxID=3048640 RepID=UPI002AB43DF3|nr:AEC family transporter [Herbaspirillum sp. RTI4]MDY7580067.1 AEC family transporter [Herbaspirillum sp. RTI4]MEA9983294.1 AEC family transporter [Herbaspirillum sp. RTI4]
MSIATLLMPDFLMILLGFIIYRMTNWGDTFWTGVEKMVYYLLFPALLFYSTARLKLHFETTGRLLEVGMLALLTGIVLTWIGKLLIKTEAMTYASGMQTAYRFNSYIALAIASRLAGEDGIGLMALLLGFGVPLCNIAAVHALASGSGKGNVLRELSKNPLLIATSCGLLFSVSGLVLPEIVGAVLLRLGNASLALGLLMVGAGLRLSAVRENKVMTAYFTAIKLLAVPAAALLIGRQVGLPDLQLKIVVLFCAMPTASSCFILATRMGGNGPATAFLVSFGTLLSALTLPFWLSVM